MLRLAAATACLALAASQPALADPTPEGDFINALRCSDLVSNGTVNQDVLSRFKMWLVGVMMGASSLGPVDLTSRVKILDAATMIVTYCSKKPNESVVSATMDDIEFFENLLNNTHRKTMELKDPSPAQ